MPQLHKRSFRVALYDLSATLESGQAFRWEREGEEAAWTGVIDNRWVRLVRKPKSIEATCIVDPGDWGWLRDYLLLDEDHEAVIASFPDDEALRVATKSCAGLRLLRQPKWECLASFICSASKQIVQIRQIVRTMCERYGASLSSPTGVVHAFPTPERIAQCSEEQLRECKTGWRAKYLTGSAVMVCNGEVELDGLADLDCAEARRELMRLPGVGRKVADCVLLFAYGFQEAFPIDVWIDRGLRELYFPRREPTRKRLLEFTASHFGPNAGYAQQYLFHYVRTQRAT
jgi:N-glycosylase/DNA lyase